MIVLSHLPEPLAVVRTVAELRARIALWRRHGETVALVPTMGSLHEGHLALVQHASQLCQRVCVSLFVNPTQFSPTEDFQSYPRDEETDRARLETVDCDLLYAPAVTEMYPAGFATSISVGGASQGLCGAYRPHMFAGVATVVTKLLNQVQPDVAVFGEKDYQQLLVIRRFVRDLDLPVQIEGLATVREPDGLAMSSRNAYLTPAERAAAPTLFRALSEAAERLAAGGEAGPILAETAQRLQAVGFASIDYIEMRDSETLAPIERPERPARLLAAARLGRARLIDNVPVPHLRHGSA